VRNVIADLVGMSLGDGLGRERVARHTSPSKKPDVGEKRGSIPAPRDRYHLVAATKWRGEFQLRGPRPPGLSRGPGSLRPLPAERDARRGAPEVEVADAHVELVVLFRIFKRPEVADV